MSNSTSYSRKGVWWCTQVVVVDSMCCVVVVAVRGLRPPRRHRTCGGILICIHFCLIITSARKRCARKIKVRFAHPHRHNKNIYLRHSTAGGVTYNGRP